MKEKKLRRIVEAASKLRQLSFNVCFISYREFKAHGKLPSHEVARGHGQLVMLDTFEQLVQFVSDHPTLFVSHQWLGYTEPDPFNLHFLAICRAISALCAEKHVNEDELYVWCDYVSIPQANKTLQSLSISSLTVYSSICRFFVIVARRRSTPTGPAVQRRDLHEARLVPPRADGADGGGRAAGHLHLPRDQRGVGQVHGLRTGGRRRCAALGRAAPSSTGKTIRLALDIPHDMELSKRHERSLAEIVRRATGGVPGGEVGRPRREFAVVDWQDRSAGARHPSRHVECEAREISRREIARRAATGGVPGGGVEQGPRREFALKLAGARGGRRR